MKRFVYIITALIFLWQALPALAVTDKEMEQARVIATQTYLRYANDGSGYLDALHPSTMAELEKKLKPKEKENIKAFKAIPVPAGYESWDKQKLVDYWSTTAFSHAGLSQKGKVGKNPARKKLNNMKVAAPAPASAAPAQSPTPAQQGSANSTKPAATAAPTNEKPAPATEKTTPAAAPSQTPAHNHAPVQPTNQSLVDIKLDSAQAEAEEARLLAEAALAAEDDAPIKKESNNTWVYVLILCILVGVVVALVVFASNVMKKNAVDAGVDKGNSEETKMLTNELKKAYTRIDDLQAQNASLRNNIEALKVEINKLRFRSAQSAQAPIKGIPRPAENPEPAATAYVEPAPAAAQPTTPAPQPAPVAQPEAAPKPAADAATHLRTIYLGRANTKGIFIRADRTLNPGNSVFRLDTTDGLAGSFKVVADSSVIDKVIEHPAEMLSAACVGPELGNTSGLQKIVTDSAGTAIFKDGCWRVMRKAKIHYE